MKKFCFDNKEFYLDNGRLFDDSFIEVPKVTSNSILQYYFGQIDYHSYGEDELLNFIKELKSAEFFNPCLNVIFYGLTKFSASHYYKKTVLPIITSCYRLIGTPQKAINFWLEKKDIFQDCVSAPLLTSLAAAYCDIGKYDFAKKYADRAYALQGGSQEYETELSIVYRRIKKESSTS